MTDEKKPLDENSEHEQNKDEQKASDEKKKSSEKDSPEIEHNKNQDSAENAKEQKSENQKAPEEHFKEEYFEDQDSADLASKDKPTESSRDDETEKKNIDPYDEYYEEDYYDYQEDYDDNDSAKKVNSEASVTEEPAPSEKKSDNVKEPDDDEEDEELASGNPEKKMPFLEHLEELRWTILWSLIAVLVGAIGCYIFAKEIIEILLKPLPENESLIFLSPTGGFMVYIKVAIFSGLVVALPFVVYQFWKFIVPGLLAKEKKLVPPIAFFTVLCFAVGATFAYLFIIPFGLKFLLGFETESFQASIEVGKYLGFVVTIILVFGTVFELPVLSFFLTKVGILNPEFLKSKRRYGIVIIFIAAAVLTPPDIFTQLALAFPLILLYEISIWVSKVAQKKEDKQEESAGEPEKAD